MLEQHQRITI